MQNLDLPKLLPTAVPLARGETRVPFSAGSTSERPAGQKPAKPDDLLNKLLGVKWPIAPDPNPQES
jgi:hypothetical protein